MKFPKLVIEEAKALKKHATEQERNRLDFTSLDPTWKPSCVYGQMTGTCDSSRAVELITTCARRVYKSLDGIYTKNENRLNPLNGSPVGMRRDDYWSPIEVFIVRDRKENQGKGNKKLIQFLKGEIKSL